MEPSSQGRRVLAFDRLRGLVMVLMTLDHAVFVFSNEKIALDSAYLGETGGPLTLDGSPWPFLTRWVTHLCAPVFVFLVGASLAQSVARRRAEGHSERSIDRHLVTRGGLLIALELWLALAWGAFLVQVAWAIGATLIALAALRRLPPAVAGGLGLLWILVGEALLKAWGLGPGAFTWGAGWNDVLEGLFLVPRAFGFGDPGLAEDFVSIGPLKLMPMVIMSYPLLGWLAIALLGWWFGSCFVAWSQQSGRAAAVKRATRVALVCGVTFLVVAALVRWAGAYGNLGMPHSDGNWLRWLQVSKYPPSLSFVGLELGLGLLLLASFLLLEGRSWARRSGPLVVLGQTALIYYCIHAHVLQLGRALIARFDQRFETPNLVTSPDLPLAYGWWATAATLALLIPVCAIVRARR